MNKIDEKIAKYISRAKDIDSISTASVNETDFGSYMIRIMEIAKMIQKEELIN